ncbi:MAG TPA: sulfite exporter TauE/SafE family protein [Alphaproteobacteria bacterium]|nr:sulfite exporter TauE/SafE family protein [Alphaproteobacteria bacterium]
MPIYLPIAELSLDVFMMLAIGGGVGLLAGMFGIGGGFLITPLLIFLGVPPAVAAATGANTVIAPSVSGVLSHWRRRAVDLKMGAVLLVGGVAGSAASVALFGLLSRLGQIDLVVQLAYVLLLGSVGVMMLVEGLRALRRVRTPGSPLRKLHRHTWLHGLPLKLRFPKSKLYLSVFLPLGLGLVVGVLSGLMGIGGGFLLVPAMIYLLGMPTSVVVGTSLMQIIFVSSSVTWLQSWSHQTVDAMLALVLIFGAAAGAPLGARLGARLKAEQTRVLMALLIVAVALRLGSNLVLTPAELYSVETHLTSAP